MVDVSGYKFDNVHCSFQTLASICLMDGDEYVSVNKRLMKITDSSKKELIGHVVKLTNDQLADYEEYHDL